MGKDLRSRMKGDHKLDTRGYEGKKPVWDMVDTNCAAQGKAMPFGNINLADHKELFLVPRNLR